jgi:ABC-type transporter Mla subunit MlaD
MAEKIKVLLEVDDNGTVRVVDQLNEKLDQTEKSAENAKKSTASLAQQLSTIKGPIGQVVQGFQGMGQAMKIMMANPLGIFLSVIAGLLYSLKRALSDSEEGQEKMNRVTSVFGALLGNLTDLVASLGEKLIDAFTNPMDALKSFANFFKDQIVNRIVGFF